MSDISNDTNKKDKPAVADIGDERAQLNRAQRNYDRLKRIAKVDRGAVSAYALERAEAEFEEAKSQMPVAEAWFEGKWQPGEIELVE